MNYLASDILLLALDRPVVVGLMVPLLSAIFALRFLKPASKLGRAGYFCMFGVLLLVWRLLFILGSVVAENDKSVYFPFWVLVFYLGLGGTGICLGLASSARAMAAYNHRTYWFLGFIPIANLALLLKRSRQREKMHFSQLAGNAALIGAGCLMLGTLYLPAGFFAPAMLPFVGSGEYDRILDGDVTQQEGYKRALGMVLQEQISSIRPPRSIDAAETFVGKEADGTIIRLTFERTNGVSYGGSTFWQVQESFEVCRDTDLRVLMEVGAAVEMKFVTQQGMLLDTLIVTAPVCPTLPEVVSHYIQGFANLATRGIRIDEETISTAGNYDGKKVVIDFQYVGDIGRLSQFYIKEKICGHPIFENITVFDKDVRGVYKSDKGESLGEATVDYVMCQSLKKR